MKTIKQVEITPIFVEEYLPEDKDMKDGELYISEKWEGSSHFCFCGCGMKIYIQLSEFPDSDEWLLTKHENGKVTVSPSLLHLNGCKSHYIITKNKANFV